jgi:hypothetical protein
VLSYKAEPEDSQKTTTMKFLIGKIEPTRKASSLTEREVRPIPRYDRFEYVKSQDRRSVQEFHDFKIKEVPNTVLLNRDHFFRKLGDNHWNIVLTTPRTMNLPGVSQDTELLVTKIVEENYSYLVPEFDSLKHLETGSALRLATTIEEATNISKLEVENPFQKRVIEDIQWNVIGIKRRLYEIADNQHVDQARKELTKIVESLKNKMLALEEINRAINKLGVDEKEALKEFRIKKLPKGRVELTWTKSG